MLKRGRCLTVNWDTYVWGRAEDWESDCPVRSGLLESKEALRYVKSRLLPFMSEKKLDRRMALIGHVVACENQ